MNTKLVADIVLAQDIVAEANAEAMVAIVKCFGELVYTQEAILERTQNGVTRYWVAQELNQTGVTFRCYEDGHYSRDARVGWGHFLGEAILKTLGQILD